MQLRRKFAVESKRGPTPLGGFGAWDLDIPHLYGVFDGTYRWNTGGNGATDRCSQLWYPKVSAGFDLHEIWAGTQFNLPGQGERELLYLPTGSGHAGPSTGGPYPWTARGDIRFSCTTMLNGYPGQGFIAHLPDGTRYVLNVGIERPHGFVTQDGARTSRTRVYLMASRVEDRFGRGVTYHWSGSQLNSIVADDGRTITLTWTNGRITSASAHGRTWTYSYSGTLGEPAVDWLHQVTQPDASKFTYVAEGTLIPLYPNPDVPNDATCQEADAAVSTFHLTATHPAGARVNYSFNYQRHYRSGVPTGACVGDGNGAFSLAIPDYSDVYSLVSREQFGIQPVTDPVLVTPTTLRTFSYETASYGRTTAAIPCASCPQSKTTRVTEQDGSVGEYEFGVLHALNEGRLLKTVTRASAGGAILREEINTYVTEADAASAPYPDVYGINSGAIDPAATRVRPIKQTTIKQQGVDFIQSTTLFDSYARPRYLTRSSTLGYSRSEVRTYHDHLGKWVVGQLAALEVGAQRPQETTYDPTWALPTHKYAFGKLKRQTTYHTSGDQAGRPHEVYDGSSLKKTTLTNYYRGTPQLVTYHDATTESAVVNALGEITSLTDAMGYTTGYQYDAGGRLSLITPPASDPLQPAGWTATSIVYAPLTGNSVYGIPAGHWRRTETTGARVSETYYDALWRPILERRSSGGSTEIRAVRRMFDHANRESFVSYPRSTFTSYTDLSTGTDTFYDGLGRVTGTAQDAEAPHGTLSTSRKYLTAFRTQDTNARNHSTTTTYQAFDQPSYDYPMVVTAPEGLTTTYTRDVYGKPLTLTRSGAYTPPGGSPEPLSVERRFVYDPYQRLCKTIEPDAGITVMDYDASNNLSWKAPGQAALTSTSDCQRSSVPVADRSTHVYDARNRLVAVDHPSGTEDVGYTYFADGALQTATTGTLASIAPVSWSATASEWAYTYNKRRLLESETLSLPADGRSFTLDWSYNGRGDRAGLVYPSGLSLAFSPNVHGEPVQVGTFASGATYHPNGTLDDLTYGNAAVRDVSLNARQLPSRIRDTRAGVALLDHTLSYDPNANLAGIVDGAAGGLESRTLGYDGRDRLTSVSGGVETYAYDPLDNVRRSVIGGVDRRFTYSASQRLETIARSDGTLLLGYTWNDRGQLTRRTRYTLGSGGFVSPTVFRSGFESPYVASHENFAFDKAGRLTAFADQFTHRYDAHQRRVASFTPFLGTNRYQVYSRTGELLYVEDAGRNERIDYIHLNGTLVAQRSRPTASETATTSYLHSDHRGTPSVKTASGGTIDYRSRLQPYGTPYDGLYREGPGFTKHATDEVSELSYMQQRYYDPVAMRFLSPDSVGADAGSFNRYWYANNNPYTFADPDGRESGCLYANSCGNFTHVNVESAGAVADFTPGVGDIKGFVEAIASPSLPSLSAAVVGLVPIIGDAAAKGIKGATNVAEAAADARGASTLSPGPHAGESIPVDGPGRATAGQQAEINRIGQDTGCHTCGATDPGTASGNHVLDHQPPSSLNPPGGQQRGYPHCIDCSRRQGGEVNAERRRIRESREHGIQD